MNYCGPKGIPLSGFLQWDQTDQDAALMWQSHESRRYPDGTHPDDWDPAEGGSSRAYHPHIDVHPGAALLEAASSTDDFQQAGKGAHVHLAAGPASDCPRCTQQD